MGCFCVGYDCVVLFRAGVDCLLGVVFVFACIDCVVCVWCRCCFVLCRCMCCVVLGVVSVFVLRVVGVRAVCRARVCVGLYGCGWCVFVSMFCFVSVKSDGALSFRWWCIVLCCDVVLCCVGVSRWSVCVASVLFVVLYR